MLVICDEFTQEYNLTFNTQKYQLLHYNSHSDPIQNVEFNDTNIQSVEQAVHLGIPLNTQHNSNLMKETTNHFYVTFNVINSVFSLVQLNAKYKLFKTFCMPLYGCVLWDFSNKNVNIFFTAWRKCVRHLFNLPYNTHSVFLPLVCNDMPIEVQLHNRFIKFFINQQNHNNYVINLCARLATNGSQSDVSNSLSYVSYIYNMDKSNMNYSYDT